MKYIVLMIFHFKLYSKENMNRHVIIPNSMNRIECYNTLIEKYEIVYIHYVNYLVICGNMFSFLSVIYE